MISTPIVTSSLQFREAFASLEDQIRKEFGSKRPKKLEGAVVAGIFRQAITEALEGVLPGQLTVSQNNRYVEGCSSEFDLLILYRHGYMGDELVDYQNQISYHANDVKCIVECKTFGLFQPVEDIRKMADTVRAVKQLCCGDVGFLYLTMVELEAKAGNGTWSKVCALFNDMMGSPYGVYAAALTHNRDLPPQEYVWTESYDRFEDEFEKAVATAVFADPAWGDRFQPTHSFNPPVRFDSSNKDHLRYGTVCPHRRFMAPDPKTLTSGIWLPPRPNEITRSNGDDQPRKDASQPIESNLDPATLAPAPLASRMPRAQFSDILLALKTAGITKNLNIITDVAVAVNATSFSANPTAHYINMYRDNSSRAVACVYAASCDSMSETDRDLVLSKLQASYPSIEAKKSGSNGYGIKFNQ